MGKFVLKRFFNMILVMLGVSVIVFLLLRLSSFQAWAFRSRMSCFGKRARRWG